MSLENFLDEAIESYSPIQLVGRRSKVPLSAAVVGELTLEDLRGREPVNAAPQTLKIIRTSHHKVARFLAEGMTPIQVSAVTGYSVDRIYGLQMDTTFKSLMNHYSEITQAHITDTAGMVLDLANDAIGELSNRLESNAESFTIKELTELSKVSLDRSGHSPVQKTENLNVNCSAELVKGAHELIRTRNAKRVTILDARESSPEETKSIDYKTEISPKD